MSGWLQDGKSAIQEAVADAFHRIEESAKAGMQPRLLQTIFDTVLMINLLVWVPRTSRVRSQK